MDDIEENIGAAADAANNDVFLDSSQVESQASVDVFETSVEIHPIPQEVIPSPPKISSSRYKLLKNSKSSVVTSSKGHSSATTTNRSSNKLTPLENYNSLPEIEGELKKKSKLIWSVHFFIKKSCFNFSRLLL